MLRRPFLRALSALLIVSLVLPAGAAERRGRVVLIDRILVVVNNDVITRFEFNERLNIVQRQLQQQNIPLPARDVLEKQLLERLINEKVQLQFAQETGIRVDDATLDRAIANIAENNQLRLDEFRQVLERDGVSFAKFRENIRNEITLARLREREADNRVNVTESEVDHYLNSQAANQNNDTEFHVGHILIQVPDQASPDQIQMRKARADQALAELKKGADFGQISAGYSDAPNALQGGDLGWRTLSRLPQLFADAITPMQVGEHSPILRSPNGFHILKLIDKRGRDVPLVVTQTHARHILVKTNELISEADARHRLTALKERLDNGADFAELARLHSEDNSAARGGDLGWLSPGDTVPEFERAMDALAIKAISAPIRSPFGLHLIQVIERRKQDVSKEKERLRARLELRDRKADEAYQEFVRQLRDRAFIEYKLDER